MTNAEKLAKDTDRLRDAILCGDYICKYCIYRYENSGYCQKKDCFTARREGVKQWLESEVEENAKIH